MLLGLFLRLTLLSVGIDQVIAPAPPSGLNRLPAGSSDNLRSASMQGHQHPPYRASETKPEKGPVPAMQEPATLPHRPRVSSPLSKTAVTPSSTDMTVETLARQSDEGDDARRVQQVHRGGLNPTSGLVS
ncbi:hypothetical protein CAUPRSCDRAFT_12559 [Caulochytrium protostelioides]|uniref:Uncharacterized protein n=1 Tax=Caulochytrium protostelioides TaxID=1555241 RepID=A0A4P9WRL0_9FUNG|nr:hypothetical protein CAUPRSCDRAFT_12559 [Caulochytrium protostelioides]